MRLGAVALLAAVAISCSSPPSASSSPSASAAAASPSSPSSATPSTTVSATSQPATGEIRVELDDTTEAAVADSEVLIVTRTLPTGGARIEAIDLATRARSIVREIPTTAVSVTSVRDGVIAFTVTEDGPRTQTGRVRVFAGRWRDPATIKELDDFVMNINGGDSWNAYPRPETNGWEIVWMRSNSDPAPFYELMRRDDGGVIRAVYFSNVPFTFSLSRGGEIAVGEIAPGVNPPATVALRVWSPRDGMRDDVAKRPARDGSGYVKWSGGKIAWSNGLGLVTPIRSVELVDPATGARETLSNPAGCSGYGGATDAQISFVCGDRADHIELARGPGPARVGPPVPLVQARAIIRTVAGPPRVAFVTPVITNDPRPGTGARF